MKSAMSGRPLFRASQKMVPVAASATPVARPSSPSMRLSAFVTPTIQRTVSGKPRTPSSRVPKGVAMVSAR